MTRAFSRYYRIPEEQVIAGNGTTFFIYTLPMAMGIKTALVAGPTYADYADACRMYGVDVSHHITKEEDSFVLDTKALAPKAAKSGIVFICNPNNPTGMMVEKQKLVSLITACPDTFFVVDESYLPFADPEGSNSLLTGQQFSNLAVLTSMSKIFTIPGLRTGFLTAREPVIKRVMAFYQPWSVNALAQSVVRSVFESPEFMAPFITLSCRHVENQRSLFAKSLENEKGIRLFDSVTSFILARLESMNAETFCKKVGNHKILVRNCSNFTGLDDRFVRFSLKKEALNMRLSGVIKEILSNDR
jgi:threonine-phosphate decarboxylase